MSSHDAPCPSTLCASHPTLKELFPPLASVALSSHPSDYGENRTHHTATLMGGLNRASRLPGAHRDPWQSFSLKPVRDFSASAHLAARQP